MDNAFAEEVVAHAANASSSAQIIALSYYGESANGYSMQSAHRSMIWLKSMVDAHFGGLSGAARPRLHVAEFGTLTAPSGHASPEPGAFGAAWTVSAWLVGLELGFEELYHWTDADRCSTATLLYGWAWTMAVAELLFESDADDERALTFLASSAPIDVVDAARSRVATSVAGVLKRASVGRQRE